MTIRSRTALRFTIPRLGALLALGLAAGCGGSGDAGSKATAPKAAPAVSIPIAVSNFAPITEIKNGELSLSLGTDLPDSTAVTWRVYRPYVRELSGQKLDYSVSLGFGTATVAELKKGLHVDVSDTAFKQLLAKQREQAKARHQSFNVGGVGKEILVSLSVTIEQGPPFERLNANLKGPMVIEKEYPGLGTGKVIFWDKPVK